MERAEKKCESSACRGLASIGARHLNWLPAVLLALASYVLGGVSAGYWLVRWHTGRDVRDHGSGATGATNVGRALGPTGFALTLTLDASKAAVAVLAARHFALGDTTEHACALAVLAGHIWPPMLRFRGGKGIAPLLGAWLVLAPLALLPSLAFTALAWIVTRRFATSGLGALCLLPFSAAWFGDARDFAGATLALALVLWAHRDVLVRARPVSLSREGSR